jgi:hypothetical protein
MARWGSIEVPKKEAHLLTRWATGCLLKDCGPWVWVKIIWMNKTCVHPHCL